VTWPDYDPAYPPSPRPQRLRLDAGRYWAGAVATALVAALAATVGVVVFRGVFDIDLVDPPDLLGTDTDLGRYVGWAVVAALAAAALLHLLILTTPRPRAFFAWIMVLATIAAATVPFTVSAPTRSRVCSAVIVAVIGLVILSLLSATASRTIRLIPRTG
jgi:Family of unknown function (DUF6069)